MKKIEKLELPYDDGKGNFSSGSGEIHILRKVNEIIDVLNSWVFEPTLTIPSQSQKQPEKCDCDYCKAYRFSMEKEPEEKLKKEDMLRWLRNGGILKVESEKQEEWREKIKQMVLTDCFKDQPDIQRYIDFIEQLLSEREKELLEWVISEEDIPQNVSSLWASLRWFEIYKEAHKRLSKLLKEKENEEEKTNK